MPDEVIDQDLGMHLFLDVERWRLDDQILLVLPGLTTPNELGVEIAVSTVVRDLNGTSIVVSHHHPVFGGGDVLSDGSTVPEGFDLLGRLFACHG